MILNAVIWAELLVQLEQHPFDELIILDLTASETVSSYYPEFAQIGAHLITANKLAGAAESAFYQRVLPELCRASRCNGAIMRP